MDRAPLSLRSRALMCKNIKDPYVGTAYNAKHNMYDETNGAREIHFSLLFPHGMSPA